MISLLKVVTEVSVQSDTGRAAHVSGGETKYDVFLAAPLATISRELRSAYWADVWRVQQALKETLQFKNIYLVGENEAPGEGADAGRVFEILRNSDRFVALYPEQGPFQVLVELGFAMATMQPVVIFTRDPSTLPFLARSAMRAHVNIACYTADTVDDVIGLIRQHRQQLFGRHS